METMEKVFKAKRNISPLIPNFSKLFYSSWGLRSEPTWWEYVKAILMHWVWMYVMFLVVRIQKPSLTGGL